MSNFKSNAAQLEPETKKEMNSGDSRPEDDAVDLPEHGSEEIELGVDELCLIFRNDWISAGDLLGFRMVKRSWRDAATITLLERNACCVDIHLKKKDTSTPGQGQTTSSSHKLSQLTELISNSPKFPTTKFSIHTSTEAYKYIDCRNFPDLLQFFQLHGGKIRTLCPHGWITKKLLFDVFTIYTPTLACLDLKNGKLWSSKEKLGHDRSSRSDHDLDLKWNSKALSITSLVLDDPRKNKFYCPDPDGGPSASNGHESNGNANADLVHWLLSSPSKLFCIENVTLDTLGVVLREGKGHLIRSFHYVVYESVDFIPQMMTQFVAIKPNLVTVTLDMEYKYLSEDEGEALEPPQDITLVNAFIHSIKDTVQELTFCFKYGAHDWNSKVKIPPMKNLKSITINGNATADSKRTLTRRTFWATERRGGGGLGLFDLHENFIQFEDGISAQDYFPSLKKITMYFDDFGAARDTIEANLMSFFRFKSRRGNNSVRVWDSLPKVDILDIEWDVAAGLYHYEGTPQNTLLPEMFPNIRILKLRSDDLFLLEPFCWTICPKVEFMEIYEIQSFRADYDEDEEYALSLSHYVDRFFTGFPLEICHKLRTTQLPDEKKNPDMMAFLQVGPSICELKHLKELKLQFVVPFSSEFASVVTGVNAFLRMPNTKFIFSYDSEIFRRARDPSPAWKRKEEVVLDDKATLAAEELCFGSIKPYVQIVHECRKMY